MKVRIICVDYGVDEHTYLLWLIHHVTLVVDLGRAVCLVTILLLHAVDVLIELLLLEAWICLLKACLVTFTYVAPILESWSSCRIRWIVGLAKGKLLAAHHLLSSHLMPLVRCYLPLDLLAKLHSLREIFGALIRHVRKLATIHLSLVLVSW